ncbi:PsbP-related protein [Clostridium fallax]|uniref:PsbP protein n=1 Tax=Clostridium fallax TaxID=1533 RepID=A0A1M4TBT1_9CLOT|nr:PsbP-related protein [Clostridium fallax]SHE41697.1 hypothetical protein SAMN05443638_102107 [Clostridium fallax]SQB22683.1 membrane-associated protein [Clostridium fallax]
MKKFMNRKQLGMTILLIGLIVVLYGAQIGLNNKLKFASLTAYNIKEFKEFNIEKTNYCYSLPDNWFIEEKKYPGNYILDHKDLKSDELGINGYIQILSSDKTIKEIVLKDKEKIENKIEDYEKVQLEIKGRESIKVTYKEKLKAGKTIFFIVYYLKLDENKIAKVSFNVEENKYKEDFNDIFEAIVDSINKK